MILQLTYNGNTQYYFICHSFVYHDYMTTDPVLEEHLILLRQYYYQS